MRRISRPLSWRKLGCFFGTMALAAIAAQGVARADNDGGVTKTSQTNVAANPITCQFTEGSPTTSTTSFSFDISWIDASNRSYLLADRSHGNTSSDTEGGMLSGAYSGDLLMINVDKPGASGVLAPPANDPFAGIRCDANASFGGTNAAGRNEITGPNGVFTVGADQAWAGDGPSHFVPGQTDSASDYATDPCDSSVRVFSLISDEQIDHIDVGGCFRTDEGGWDPVDQLALFANPSEKPITSPNATALNNSAYITLISTKPVPKGQHHPIVKQINFDGTNGTILADAGIEQAAYSKATGLFYISIPGTVSDPNDGYVTVLDPKQSGAGIRVLKNIKLKDCAPNGAALGPDDELLVGCSVGPEQVIDITNPSVKTIINGTTGGCDEVAYNAGTKSFYGACTDSNPLSTDNLDITDAGKNIQFDVGLNTGAAGAHSVAADRVTASEWMPMFGGVCGSGIACVATFSTPPATSSTTMASTN